MLRDQACNPQPGAALTPGARDFQHRDLSGDVTERGGAADVLNRMLDLGRPEYVRTA
jgi:hypothetical protein